jgi:hypothetical protein
MYHLQLEGRWLWSYTAWCLGQGHIHYHIHATLHYNRQVSMAFTYGSSDRSGSWPLTSTQSHSLKLNDLSYHRHHPQNSPRLSIVFLRRFCHTYLESDHQVFTSLDFATIYFLLPSEVVSLASNPQPGGPVPVFMSPQGQSGPVISPGNGVPFPSLSATSRAMVGGFLSRLHTGYTYHIVWNNDTSTGTNIRPA